MDNELLLVIKNYKGRKYIYGAGNLGQYLYRKLLSQDITVDGFIVDDILSDSEQSVYTMKQIIESGHKKKLLIIGYAGGYAKYNELVEQGDFDKVIELALPFDHHAHFGKEWVEANSEVLCEAERLLEDELSVHMFRAFISAVSLESVSYVRDVFDSKREYFANDVIQLGDKEAFLEVGAFQGKSVKDFANACEGKYKRIVAIEPDSDNFLKLKQNLDKWQIDAELYNVGCWNKHDYLSFDSDDKISRLSDEGQTKIEVDKLDNIIGSKEISLINLGVSVAQREILLGAQDIISSCKPKMVIFLGSAKEELFTIPLLLKEIRQDYKLYMRFVDCMPSRFFLFAV